MELTSRLPELAWKLSRLNFSVLRMNIPKSLFQTGGDEGSDAYIREVQSDIQVLAQQKSKISAHYLAKKIQQKISVLVALCQLDHQPASAEGKAHFGVNMLLTRQQWINALETEIKQLADQKQALERTLAQKKKNQAPSLVLSLQAELGAVIKRMTLTQEEFNKITR